MTDDKHVIIPDDVVDIICSILKRGDTVELKRENGKLVVVEIKRKVKIKTPIIG